MVSIPGGDFFIWKKRGNSIRYFVSDKPPKPDGTPRKRGIQSASISVEVAHILCGGKPPMGNRVYMMGSKLIVADVLKIA